MLHHHFPLEGDEEADEAPVRHLLSATRQQNILIWFQSVVEVVWLLLTGRR